MKKGWEDSKREGREAFPPTLPRPFASFLRSFPFQRQCWETQPLATMAASELLLNLLPGWKQHWDLEPRCRQSPSCFQ